MRYITENEFRKQLEQLTKELKEAKDLNQKRKIEDEIEYLRKLRFESSQQESVQAMNERR